MAAGSWRSSLRVSQLDQNAANRGGSIPAREQKSPRSLDGSYKTIATQIIPQLDQVIRDGKSPSPNQVNSRRTPARNAYNEGKQSDSTIDLKYLDDFLDNFQNLEEAKSMNSPSLKKERVGGGRKISRSNSRWGEGIESDRLKAGDPNLDH